MTWEEFLEDAKTLKGIAVQKVNDATDLASLKIRLATVEHRLKTAYEALGKASYQQISSEQDCAEAIAKGVATVKDLIAEADGIREQIGKLSK